MPTLFIRNVKQFPGVAPGGGIEGVPQAVGEAYEEARDAMAAGSNTASVLMSRKLLMNIAVAQGADEGKTFVEYVEHLAKDGYVPPNGKGWVDHIRSKGNEATHEVKIMSAEDAKELITFTEMLLRFIYEFPTRVPAPPSTP
ncbi:MAG: DUF4145 domain-containing protein [Actinomycetota bacterium]